MSGLTGITAKQLGDTYVAASGKPWTATLAFSHAIFEVALDVVKRTADLSDKAAIMDAITKTDLQTIVGLINWANGPMKNITKTPMAGGVTIVWIEHVVHALLSVAKRLIVVDFGRKIADGLPAEVLASRDVQSV